MPTNSQIVYGCFGATTLDVHGCDRDPMVHKVNNLAF